MDQPEVDSEGRTTFADLGITPREVVQDTAFGKYRNWSNLENYEWAFLGLGVVALVGTIGLTIARLVESIDEVDQIFCIVLIVNCVFSIVYLLDGVVGEKPYDILIFCIACIFLLVYLITNIVSTEGWDNTLKLARLVGAGILLLVLIPLGIYTGYDYYQSGRLIFRILGANIELQSMCRTVYKTFSCLMLDLQLQLSMVILILNGDEVVNILEILVLVIGSIFAIIWAVTTYFVIKLERRSLTWLIFALGFLEPAYIIFRFVYLLYEDSMSANNSTEITTMAPLTTTSAGGSVPPSTPTPPSTLSLNLIIYSVSVFALLVRLLLFYLIIASVRNYGRGLKEKLSPTISRPSYGTIREEQ